MDKKNKQQKKKDVFLQDYAKLLYLYALVGDLRLVPTLEQMVQPETTSVVQRECVGQVELEDLIYPIPKGLLRQKGEHTFLS